MTTVAESTVPKANAEDGSQPSKTDDQDNNMEPLKAEDASVDSRPTVSNGESQPADEPGAEDDSEAETLIQSPEKRRALGENVATSPSTKRANPKDQGKEREAVLDTAKRSKKRKRGPGDGELEASSKASSPQSSPLSSPVIPAQSRESDSDVSNRPGPTSAKSQRTRRNGVNAESEGVDGNAQAKTHRRRPSDIMPPSSKHRSRGSLDTGASERRETRSATYPRQSSEDRSPSPGPTSRRDHRRGLSTQFPSGEFGRKKRGRPPNIHTRRNTSGDRARSSSEDSSSPRLRPALQKLSFHDHDTLSPAKASGTRKWRDKNGRTFLSRACNNDDLERARSCLQERPEDINLPDNAGNSPLQIAALEGFTNIVRFLLEKGADVDTRNIDKETPLIDAVENGHVEVVKLLLEHGANPRLGNARGDEPYELVPQDDPHYKAIRKMIADAKDRDVSKQRRSNDTSKDDREEKERGPSRAASASSPRDSPPVIGPRSPPAVMSRRRTGRSESTRNDLLWQANTPENLRLLAAKGNVQGVIYVLNILQKAEPEAVIAAAKAGHEEVLQYLLAMGDADPDPAPVPDMKALFNTPMLAAIGRGHLDVVKLLVEQSGFNPTQKWGGKTYFDIAADRKGDNWQKEHDILKLAYQKYASGKQRKTSSPRKTRDQDRPKEKKIRRSASPASNLRQVSSPSLTHKSLPEKSPRSALRERKREGTSPQQSDRRKAGASGKESNNSIAVASDQDQTVAERRSHKHRRSQSDLPMPANLEAEIAHRRRRLVTGKEHRRRKSGATGDGSGEASETDVDVKREHDVTTPGLKRTRNSVSPGPNQPKDADSERIIVKKRRTVLDGSPEETRPSSNKDAATLPEIGQDTEMVDANSEAKAQVEEAPSSGKLPGEDSGPRSKSPGLATEITPPTAEDPGTKDTKAESPTVVLKSDQPSRAPTPVPDEVDEKVAEAERKEREEKEEEEKRAAEEARRLEEERIAAQKIEEEKVAAEKAAREEEAAQKALAERLAAEEAEARRRAEEEAATRKREEEERQERIRRELEETKRRQEEQIRQQHLEIERRRREALPAGLARSSLLLETNDASYSQWLTRFLPLFTVRTQQLDPNCSPAVAHDLWVPNWQVAVLLATKDLNLRNYTSLDKREATPNHRDRMWRVGRFMLSYDFWTTGYNTSIKQANDIERRERPKFFAMMELFWVKLSDFEDQVVRHAHLSGIELKQRPISLRPQQDIIAEGEAKERSVLSNQHPNGLSPLNPPMVNGIHTTPPLGAGLFGNGGLRL